MSDPLVCCIMLTKDRPEMAARAVRCFREQTYPNTFLLIWDSGDIFFDLKCQKGDRIWHWDAKPKSIGLLRNEAVQWTDSLPRYAQPYIICHWDDDDVSHPNRIEEQVALLMASGKEAVGYRDMLFWRTLCQCELCKPEINRMVKTQEAWLYSNRDPRYCVGTSLCYWRKTWERRPFADLPKAGGTGEDHQWLQEVDSLGTSSLKELRFHGSRDWTLRDTDPRMIASIHGGNTSGQYANLEQSPSWKRVREWDAVCRERMTL